MSSRLRSILGGSNRVKKRPKAPPSHSGDSRASPSSSSWSDSLPRTKPGSSGKSKKRKSRRDDEEDDDHDYFHEKLDDQGLVRALTTDLTLRDVPQAMRCARDRMFTPLLDQPCSLGLSSTRVAEILNLRRNLPPVVTTAHLQALLSSPTAVERETAELVRAGVLRKVVVLRRGRDGGVRECLIASADLEGLVRASGALEEGTKGTFLGCLKDHPTKFKVSAGDGLQPEQIDQLVRGGFLTTYHNFDIGHVPSVFARPEDKGTSLSLETVSRAATGSMEAVGGWGAVHVSGGSGGARSGGSQIRPGAGGDLSLAVPGQGAYFKLLSAALSHLTGILGKSEYKELPETLLRERWDGGIWTESSQHASKRERGEFVGVWPGRTKKWREFSGLSFDWSLHEAVGAGLVEVFETGSVGRGIRLL